MTRKTAWKFRIARWAFAVGVALFVGSVALDQWVPNSRVWSPFGVAGIFAVVLAVPVYVSGRMDLSDARRVRRQ